jgi:hypothetical protein
MKLSELERLTEAATKGPWIVDPYRPSAASILGAIEDGAPILVDDVKTADADFIVAARSAMPILIEIAEAAQMLTRGDCFCEAGIGNPMVCGHSAGCAALVDALKRLEEL